MNVEVARSGGLFGLTVRGTFDTTELPEPVAGLVEDALAHLPFGRPPADPQHPDSFQYEITVTAAHRRRSARLDEAQLPEVLRDVADTALSGGQLD
jgi:hypothetical protein